MDVQFRRRRACAKTTFVITVWKINSIKRIRITFSAVNFADFYSRQEYEYEYEFTSMYDHAKPSWFQCEAAQLWPSLTAEIITHTTPTFLRIWHRKNEFLGSAEELSSHAIFHFHSWQQARNEKSSAPKFGNRWRKYINRTARFRISHSIFLDSSRKSLINVTRAVRRLGHVFCPVYAT